LQADAHRYTGICEEPQMPHIAWLWAPRSNGDAPWISAPAGAPLAEQIATAKSLGVDDEETPNNSEPLSTQHLDVYATKNGPWNPEHGDIEIPAGWDFLPSGDAFLTRTVKAAGTYWLSWQPRGQSRQHRRLLGLWAPSQAIAAALMRAEETAARRAAKRALGAQSRRRHEDRYRAELEFAIVHFLAFAPSHQELEERIAKETAAHAAVVGSGRVGRTRNLTLEDRAALSVRAYIRHRFTSYHDDLDSLSPEHWDEEYLYREIKGTANEAVDRFLLEHRRS
jgi:hypothetical protein